TATLDLSEWDGSPDHCEVREFLRGLPELGAAGHRVVHGGSRFREAVLVNDEVLAGIASLTSLAPLHQPRAIAGIEAVRAARPGLPAVACFDTAFHAGLPPAAAAYALPSRGPSGSGCGATGSTGFRTPMPAAGPRSSSAPRTSG